MVAFGPDIKSHPRKGQFDHFDRLFIGLFIYWLQGEFTCHTLTLLRVNKGLEGNHYTIVIASYNRFKDAI